jgi:hypothetical protein
VTPDELSIQVFRMLVLHVISHDIMFTFHSVFPSLQEKKKSPVCADDSCFDHFLFWDFLYLHIIQVPGYTHSSHLKKSHSFELAVTIHALQQKTEVTRPTPKVRIR